MKRVINIGNVQRMKIASRHPKAPAAPRLGYNRGTEDPRLIRRFGFEAEIFDTLACVPMGVRRKLDRVGLKVGLNQWQALNTGERLAICHLPADSAEECEAMAAFVREAVTRHCGDAPEALSDEQRKHAEPPEEPPVLLVARARAEGFVLGPAQWQRLDADERYALVKLGAGVKVSHNLRAALRELLEEKSQARR